MPRQSQTTRFTSRLWRGLLSGAVLVHGTVLVYGAVLVYSAVLGVVAAGACAEYSDTESTTGADVGESGGGAATSGDAGVLVQTKMLGAPLVFSPTVDGFGVSVALESGDPGDLLVRVRKQGTEDWGDAFAPEARASDLAQWQIDGLSAGTSYEYQVSVDDDDATVLFEGVQVTQRPTGDPFRFALITDSHIGAHDYYENQGDPDILRAVSAEIGAVTPDFVVNLGDMLDFHEYGFQLPPPNGDITRLAYLNYRSYLGDTLGRAAHFGVIGNWEGENGDYDPLEIAWSREQRLMYLPGPNTDTYPEGGSPAEDYYAFTWGDALFVVLNVMTYTPTAHLLYSGGDGTADDWTLGEDQLEWLESTLENATSTWRFLLIHHTVGGKAGDEANSAYGRGGGQAADVGEQAVVHQLMIDHGVQIFFYGHDHVFTDMVVDDIHYSMPGSAGAIWVFESADTGYQQYWIDPGWGQVDVSSDAVHVQFIAMGGELLYEYTVK